MLADIPGKRSSILFVVYSWFRLYLIYLLLLLLSVLILTVICLYKKDPSFLQYRGLVHDTISTKFIIHINGNSMNSNQLLTHLLLYTAL